MRLFRSIPAFLFFMLDVARICTGYDGAELFSDYDLTGSNCGDTCGIYAMGAAIASQGIEFDLERFLDSEYVIRERGSTTSQLAKIADSYGIRVVVFKNLNVNALVSTQGPVVLNLRGGQFADMETGHWVTFLGMSESRGFTIFDSQFPEKLAVMTREELDTVWNGDGILLLSPGQSRIGVFLSAFLNTVFPFFALAGCCFLSLVFFKRWNFSQPILQY